MDLSMPLEEAMRTQRAIRRLKPDPVDDALVLHLIELALKAPSGSNAQSWEFVVVWVQCAASGSSDGGSSATSTWLMRPSASLASQRIR